MSDNEKKPKRKCMPCTVWLYILALVGVVLAGGYYHVFHGCDLESEHSELTCEFVFKLTLLPRVSNFRTNLIWILAKWGILDFKQSIRSHLDSKIVNTTEMFVSPNISQLPIICEEWEANGIRLYSYTSKESVGFEEQPLLIYFHGGGGVMYSPKMFDATLRFLSNKIKLKIIAPNYHKSPDVVFPTAHEECLQITKYIFENSGKLGVDPKRISIGGDSFGGHAALYVAFKWRELGYDEEHAPLYTMALIYPWVQMVSLELESYLRRENQPRILTSYGIANGISLILKGDLDLQNLILNARLPLLSRYYKERQSSHPNLLPGVDWDPPTSMVETYSEYADSQLDPFATFLFQTDFSRLPPTLILAAEYDILLTEGQLLRQRMEEAGVHVEYFLFEKMFHGFCFLTPLFNVTPTFEAYDKLDEFLHKYIQ